MDCCNKNEKKGKGFLRGILYGLMPHTFCIAFIIFTVFGLTAATALLKPFLLNPYFFHILIAFSFIFVSVSAAIYLFKNGLLSLQGIKKKWKYLFMLYGTAIAVNLLLFMVIFPLTANFGGEKTEVDSELNSITLEVSIPCSGHAALINTYLKELPGVKSSKFRLPDLFEVGYDSAVTSKEQILSLDIFKTYKATVLK